MTTDVIIWSYLPWWVTSKTTSTSSTILWMHPLAFALTHNTFEYAKSASVSNSACASLAHTKSHLWLPFVTCLDYHLCAWWVVLHLVLLIQSQQCDMTSTKNPPPGHDSRSILFDSLLACALGPVVLTQAPQHCEHDPLQPIGQNLGL